MFCWENGKPPHPDTITRRFKRLATAAGLPEIDLHHVAFTMKQYVQTDLEADRQVANTLAALILGGTLVSAEVTGDADHAGSPGGGEPGEAA